MLGKYLISLSEEKALAKKLYWDDEQDFDFDSYYRDLDLVFVHDEKNDLWKF